MARRGRPPGSKEAAKLSVKDNILAVFNRLGGTSYMAKWAAKNPNEFFAIYARLLPKVLVGDPTNPIPMTYMPATPELLRDYYAKLEQAAAAAPADPSIARLVGPAGPGRGEQDDDESFSPR